MDFILEFLMTLILEGSLEALIEKKIPIFVRVVMAILLLGFYLGFVGILFYIGIKDSSGIIIGIAVFVGLLTAGAAVKKYKEIKRK